MLIKMKSMISGKEHEQEIDVTELQLELWKQGELIQNAMPNLTPDEREFIKTGITKEEWDQSMGIS